MLNKVKYNYAGNKLFSFSFVLLLAILFNACTKGSGPGGRAKIFGKVWATNLDNSLAIAKDSGYAADENVFIAYGDNNTIGADLQTSFDGSFVFEYLRAGKYKIWALSKQKYGLDKLDTIVVKEVTITDAKQELNIGDIRIFTQKN